MAIFSLPAIYLARILKSLGKALILTLQSLSSSFLSPTSLKSAYSCFAIFFSSSFGLVFILTFIIGTIFALQLIDVTAAFGLHRILPEAIAKTSIREIGPGFSGLIIAMQIGGSITAELAAMKSKDEIMAIESMGLSYLQIICGPRIIAAALATLLLNIVAIAAAIIGAYAFCLFYVDFSSSTFLQNIGNGISFRDLFFSEVKCLFFGVALSCIGIYCGLNAEKNSAAIGYATGKTIFYAVISILVINYCLDLLFF